MNTRRMASLLVGGTLLVLAAPAARAGDPTLSDCIGANENSIRLRSEHKLLQSREQSLMCASNGCPAEIRATCGKRVDDLNAAMPTIVFEAKDASGNDVSAVKVTMDGQPLVERLEGTAISLDPGEHVFTFTAESHTPVEKKYVIAEGVKDRRERVVVGAEAPPPAPPAPPPEPAGTTSKPGAPQPAQAPAQEQTTKAISPDATPAGGSSLKTIGFVLGGAGAAALVVSGIFGIEALSKKGGANCDSGNYCDAGPLADARSAATAANVALVSGAVLAGIGITLVLVARKEASEPAAATSIRLTPAVTASGAGTFLGGTW